jgi:hypothetical protein
LALELYKFHRVRESSLYAVRQVCILKQALVVNIHPPWISVVKAAKIENVVGWHSRGLYSCRNMPDLQFFCIERRA